MKNGGNFIDESSCYPFAVLLFCIQMRKACAITTKRRGNKIHICSAHGEEISFPDRESYMRPDWWTCYATWHNRVHIKTSTRLRFIELHRSIFILIETRKYFSCADAFLLVFGSFIWRSTPIPHQWFYRNVMDNCHHRMNGKWNETIRFRNPNKNWIKTISRVIVRALRTGLIDLHDIIRRRYLDQLGY